MSGTSSVPVPVFGPNGFVTVPEDQILAGAQADIIAALGGGANPALETPQGQIASSDAAIIADCYDQFVALAVEGEGADSVSLINTLLGMAIDSEKRKPVLSTITGGLSGPAVKPIALRMVWEVARAVKIPVIGLGGIMTASDAIEFMLAGASAIQIGTANFIDPTVTIKVIDGINDYLDRHHYLSVNDIIGALEEI